MSEQGSGAQRAFPRYVKDTGRFLPPLIKRPRTGRSAGLSPPMEKPQMNGEVRNFLRAGKDPTTKVD